MNADYAVMMAGYNRWMNEKVYDAAARLSDEERKRDRGAFFKSIHGTLNHIMLGDRRWLGRLVQDTSIDDGTLPLDHELYADFDALRAARKSLDDAIDAFVNTVDDAKLAATMHYVGRGVPVEHPMGWAVAQMFNHQTHHRGQTTTLLMQAGQDPGVTDLIAFLRGGGLAPKR